MLDINLLNKVERVIVHGNCHDGMASAMLLYDALEIEPKFLQHGTSEYLNLEPTPGMLFCDIAPPQDRYQEFVDAGAIVLDHHKKAKDIVNAFGSRGVFADEKLNPGVSGALLAFKEVWALKSPFRYGEYDTVHEFARLVGITDTWQKNSSDWEKARHLTCALTFYSWEYWQARLSFNWNFENEIFIGKMIYQDRLKKAAVCAQDAYTFLVDGYRVAVFNDLAKLTSDVAEILREDNYHVIAGFSYHKGDNGEPSIRFSLRSDGSIDVSDLAQMADPHGGGHTKAAGFSRSSQKLDNNPFVIFEDIFKDYLFIKGDYL